jgi:hypothetical protein
MNSLLRSGRCDSRRATCEASTASKTTNALIHHSCDMDALCCVARRDRARDPEKASGRRRLRLPTHRETVLPWLSQHPSNALRWLAASRQWVTSCGARL